jgi:predicted dehydrogenase
MILNEKLRQMGADNFRDALTYSRRDVLAAVPAAAGFYWGYRAMKGSPVKAAIIGTGGQGCSLISAMNPDYVKVVAFSEIRPSNQRRGRQALQAKFGSAARDIELIEDYHRLLDRKDIDMVMVALPLFLHAPASIEAMEKGKHVLCEKLMARTVADCKKMARAAKRTGRLLAIGHQRHYSYLYANALEVARQKEIVGDVRHIRAFWHRNQTNGGAPGAETGAYDTWYAKTAPEDARVDFAKYGYKSMDELVRWRLRQRTGAGLMAELGSHQLDACGILLGGSHPLAVSGVGVKSFFTDDREVEDHVYLTYEYPKDVVVTYSSLTTNEMEGYGEQVMGTKGTLSILSEREVYLFREKWLKDTRVTWAEQRISQPATTTTSTVVGAASAATPDTLTSRGYREEQEHLAYLIRHGGGEPRCNGAVGLADAVVALVSNLAMKTRQRIEFRKEWFDVNSDATPEAEFTT